MPGILRAISIRQPFSELILQGKKKLEYRTIRTNIRERVYIYASFKERPDEDQWRKAKKKPGTLPLGLIVGTVEITDCIKEKSGGYAYVLKNPKRLNKLLKPKNQPSPVFWRPKFNRQRAILRTQKVTR